MMKRICTFLTIALLVMAILCVGVTAAGSITISNVQFSAYEDAQGTAREDLVQVSVDYTAPKSAAHSQAATALR